MHRREKILDDRFWMERISSLRWKFKSNEGRGKKAARILKAFYFPSVFTIRRRKRFYGYLILSCVSYDEFSLRAISSTNIYFRIHMYGEILVFKICIFLPKLGALFRATVKGHDCITFQLDRSVINVTRSIRGLVSLTQILTPISSIGLVFLVGSSFQPYWNWFEKTAR